MRAVFTKDAQAIIDQAKDVAVATGETCLSLHALAISIGMDRRGLRLLSCGLQTDPSELRRRLAPPGELPRCAVKLALDDEVREMLAQARALVEQVPLAGHSTLIGLPHLVCAVLRFAAEARLDGAEPPDEARLLTLLAVWVEETSRPLSLGELTRHLRDLRGTLLSRVYGQHHAIQQFVDGLFNTEVVAAADTERQRPCGVFIFAGPPGVGKTYLAELGARHLDRPFKRFDMSAYAHGHEIGGLVGTPRMYHGAQPGALTNFVREYPNAVLLFDEIERAHVTAIQLFLQLLDAGRLQDKYTEENVGFRDTIVIFTTNVGRTLYENQNASGVCQANAAFHRSTVLDALRSEVDSRTREPYFPPAICSRLATGYPILFDHLRVDDLAQIAQEELSRVAALLETRHGQHYRVAREIPLAIVMREGAQTDARSVKAQAEAFLKDEVFKACKLFTDDRLDKALGEISDIVIEIDEEQGDEVADRLFRETQAPSVLFVGEPLLGSAYSKMVPSVRWAIASSADQVFDTLAKQAVDFVLLDLALKAPAPAGPADAAAAFHDISDSVRPDRTFLPFDHVPLAARRFAAGQRLLEGLHMRMPETPIYLMSQDAHAADGASDGIDEELLLACVRAGGARGALRIPIPVDGTSDLEARRVAFGEELRATARRLRMERMAAELARQSQVAVFDTAPALGEDGKQLRVRCRNFRLVRAVRSADAAALVSDVERPAVRFTDVVGAVGAKEALVFIRDWLREPRRFAAAGVDVPRGVLLAGPPGTGKTMLARALAGESDCAFIAASAANFVTSYQGSGPESIRALFERARRYAPSLVFIDELDAIGMSRGEVRPGLVGHGEAMALNALLTEMDGFSKSSSRPVVVIAATNHPEKLDDALKRRFSRVIEVELPTREEREHYLRVRLQAKARHAVSESMIERLAAQSAGLSIADLDRVFAQAGLMALPKEGVIDDTILGEAFEKVLMGEAKTGADPLRTARHEAGHAVLMCALGHPPVYVTIVGRGDFGGYVAPDDWQQRRSHTRGELEDLICELIGGREAERLYYEGAGGESTGPSNDLERATTLAERMVYELGMAEEIGFVRIDRKQVLPAEVATRCHSAVRRIVEAQCERARSMLQLRRGSLDGIAAALIDRGRLLKPELIELLDPEDRQRRGGTHP
jgi:ATP-dependent metalloprotease FtsH